MTSLITLLTAAASFLELMSGNWVGEGVRTQRYSGRQTQIRTITQSRMVNGALISESIINETDTSTAVVRQYSRAYWMAPDGGGLVLLGPGTDPSRTTASSYGRYSDNRLVVAQAVNGGYLIVSVTEFTADPRVIRYTETTTHNGTELSETFIEYRRTDQR